MRWLDLDALYWINHHRHALLDAVLLPVAVSGEAGFLMALVFVAVFWVGGRGDRPMALKSGIAFLALDRMVMMGLQQAVYRERPYLALQGLVQDGRAWETSSFPSGHAHTAMLVTVVLGSRWPRTLWFLVPYLLLTLYSRPYFGMHYPSDVLAGTVTGALLGCFIVAVQRRLFPAPALRQKA